MFKLISLLVIFNFCSQIIVAEPPRSNGYQIDRPDQPFFLPVKSNFRVASSNGRLRYNQPSRNYGSPQAPPSPNFAPPTFVNPQTDNNDLGLQIPGTTSRPEYSAENQNSAETFEDNHNGNGAELGRLTNAKRPQNAKQQVEQQPQVIQFEIPQVKNGFAHALAVYNPQGQQQQQLIAQYQTAPLVLEQQPLVSQQNIITQQPLVEQQAVAAQPALVGQSTLITGQPLLARQTLYAQQPLVAQYPQLTATPLVAQYRVAAPVQQQFFGNLQTQAILNPQYLQIQPALQTVQPVVAAATENIVQPTTVQVNTQQQPIVQAVVGRLSSGEPFARARTGKFQTQPVSSQQQQIQSNQILGRYQNTFARQVAEIPVQQEQQVEQQPQPFAYAAIGF